MLYFALVRKSYTLCEEDTANANASEKKSIMVIWRN